MELTFAPLELKLTDPFGISRGTKKVSQNILITLKHKHFIGLGEIAPAAVHGETVETAIDFLKSLQELQKHETAIFGPDPFAIESIMSNLDRINGGHLSVKSAINMALLDLIGKIAETPVYQWLGLPRPSELINDFTIGIDAPAVMADKARKAVSLGNQILKIKLGTSYDREIINCIRQTIGNEVLLRVDANGAWSLQEALEMTEFLAVKNTQLIEQPLPEKFPAADYQLLRRRSPIPIFADEPIRVLADLDRFSNSVDGIVVKLAKNGGISQTMRMIERARACQLKIMLGCMIESSLGITAASHLASLVDYLDLDGALLLSEDPFCGALWENCHLQLPNSTGLGVHSVKLA